MALHDDGTIADYDGSPTCSTLESITSTNSPPPQACQVCGQEGDGSSSDDENMGDGQRSRRRCRLLRCTQCRNAWYCSVDCQRLDWNRGHRQLCNRRRGGRAKNNKKNSSNQAAVPAVVQEAQLELVQLVSSLSVDQATESYHKSMDEIISSKKNQRIDNKPTNKKKMNDAEAAAATSKNRIDAVHQKRTTPTTNTTPVVQSQATVGVATTSCETQPLLSPSAPPSSPPDILLPPPCWDFYVEDLTRLSCYQIIILLNKNNNDDDDDLCSFQNDETKTTTTTTTSSHKETNDDTVTPRGGGLDITVTCMSPTQHDRHDEEEEDTFYVVRIVMQQRHPRPEKETTALPNKDDRNSPAFTAAKNCSARILQLALPAGIVILPPNNINHNSNDPMTIPHTIDTTMSGRQSLVSIRLRYMTKQQQQQQQQQSSLQSPAALQLLSEPPLLPWSCDKLLTPNEANRLACRACGHFLFSINDDDSSLNGFNMTKDNNKNMGNQDYDQSNNDIATSIHSKTTARRRRRRMNIDRVLPMPSGRYEDMADYLMCYEGQAAVDFSSSTGSSVKTGIRGRDGVNNSNNSNVTLLQDETTLVLSNIVAVDNAGKKVHDGQDDHDDNDGSPSPSLLSLPSVCRLSIPGYGQVRQQASTATTSSWLHSLGSGGNNGNENDGMTCLALACSRCCSVIGEAQEEGDEEEEMDENPEQDEFSHQPYFTYRFWKHRLVVIPKSNAEEDVEKEGEKKKKTPLLTTTATTISTTILSSTLTFMVQELIRLAETKAIFTLAIFCDKAMQEKSEVMVLRLVSWGDSSTCAAMSREAGASSAYLKDTTSAHGTASINNDLEKSIVYPLKTWRPMAKVLFEIRHVSDEPDEMFPYPQPGPPAASNKNTDIDVWSMLNQSDWCCPLPPFGEKTKWQVQRKISAPDEENKKVNQVKERNEPDSGPPPPPRAQQRQGQIVLESWEWLQVLGDLQEASRTYGKEVVFATFFAKTGRDFIHDNAENDSVTQIGLAAVPL